MAESSPPSDFPKSREDFHEFRVIEIDEDTGGEKVIRYNLLRRYEIAKHIGSGAYGSVAKAKDHLTGKSVAIKKVSFEGKNMKTYYDTWREFNIGKAIRHPCVMGLVNAFTPALDESEFDYDGEHNEVYMVMDWMENSKELFEVTVDPNLPAIPLTSIAKITHQLICGLNYLHNLTADGVLHRDVKPENILVDAHANVKLIDMGGSRRLELGGTSDYDKLTPRIGSVDYYAPERLMHGDYGKPADVWALGHTLHTIIWADRLFGGRDYFSTLADILNKLGALPEDFPQNSISSKHPKDYVAYWKDKRTFPGKDPRRVFAPMSRSQLKEEGHGPREVEKIMQLMAYANDLMFRMMQVHPDRRITLDQALEHPFLHEVRDPRLEFVNRLPEDKPYKEMEWYMRDTVVYLFFSDLLEAERHYNAPGFNKSPSTGAVSPKKIGFGDSGYHSVRKASPKPASRWDAREGAGAQTSGPKRVRSWPGEGRVYHKGKRPSYERSL